MIYPGRQAIASDGRALEDAVGLPTVDVKGLSSKKRAYAVNEDGLWPAYFKLAAPGSKHDRESGA